MVRAASGTRRAGSPATHCRARAPSAARRSRQTAASRREPRWRARAWPLDGWARSSSGLLACGYSLKPAQATQPEPLESVNFHRHEAAVVEGGRLGHEIKDREVLQRLPCGLQRLGIELA